MLILEMHFTKKSFCRIRNYSLYHTMHPDGIAHGRAVIIIQNRIGHYETNKYQEEHIQASSIVTKDGTGNIIISTIYTPPKQLTRNNTWSSLIPWANDLSPEIITQNILIGNPKLYKLKVASSLKQHTGNGNYINRGTYILAIRQKKNTRSNRFCYCQRDS